ncbi:complement C1q tumor necrosis factor-related protein 4-like [Dunckerocampus dactyliophorus]|uniref:complement C1q tumor necrosis factor-related protein 4-like n=1 Tax=Dunckerocampus dactyliophorus TaxID=161453 RepID=UPI002405CB45|nr:complement C1q tumor necrosis factor-related protein 4-like [Dunckerocampus dactyliophorus]XP_054632618.1 complement C1q tumor necrosis factor-related protein 4-like [Dunckerocampus dactyliophorus]
MRRKVDKPGKKPQKAFIHPMATILLTFIFGVILVHMAPYNQTEQGRQAAAEAPTEEVQTLEKRVDKLAVLSVSGAGVAEGKGNNDKLVLDNVYINVDEAYDTKTGIFTVPSDGVYFFTFTCHMDDGNINSGLYKEPAEWMMQVSDFTNAKDHSDTSSRMIDLKKGDKLYLKHYVNHKLIHNRQTVFSVLRVDPKLDESAEKRVVAFSVSGGNKKNGRKLVLDNVYVNVGDGYNSSTGFFTAPYEGVYFFTFSCHTVDGMIVVGVYRKKVYGNSKWMMQVTDTTIRKRHSDTISRMIHLEKGDSVYALPYFGHGLQLHYGLTVFSGFLVDAVQNLKARVDKPDEAKKCKVAFSASGGNKTEADKLVLNNVYVNVGNAYNDTAGIFTAPCKGVYFFTLSCHTRPDGIIDVDVLRKKMDGNTEWMMRVSDSTKYKEHGGTTSRMITLEAGDGVYVMPNANHTLVRYYGQTVFSGFFVEPM